MALPCPISTISTTRSANQQAGRHHNALEYAVPVIDLENRASVARRGMHDEIMKEIITEAGLPGGVVNLVHCLSESAGKALTEQRKIRAVAFIGESHYWLPDHGPRRTDAEWAIFADADLDRELDATPFMIYSLNGERCTSASRARSTIHL
jgi:hypothetical protein